MFRVGDRVVTNDKANIGFHKWAGLTGEVVPNEYQGGDHIRVKLERLPSTTTGTLYRSFAPKELDLLPSSPFLQSVRSYIESELNSD